MVDAVLVEERAPAVPGIRWRNLAWVAGAFGLMIAAIESPSFWLLNFVHVFAGVLWTGIDLFMGFMVGPILRRVDIETRRAITVRLMPRMLFLMPTLSIIAGTSGPFLAQRMGHFQLPFPALGWVIAALVIVTVLTVQGLGVLLPVNLRVYFELRKPEPDAARVARLMRRYVFGVAFQGVMQLLIIVVMVMFRTGFSF